MKKAIMLLLILMSNAACRAQLNLNQMQVKDVSIYPILKEIYDSKIHHVPDEVFLININKTDISYQFKAALLQKRDFKSHISVNDNMPIGYFNFDTISVIVFGKSVDVFFSIEETKTSFLWLKKHTSTKKVKNKIPPVPNTFEPEVWIYNFIDGEFVFEEKGMFGIFD